jgi:hypothetical protein
MRNHYVKLSNRLLPTREVAPIAELAAYWGVSDELQIFEPFQNWQRTAANTSLKVASFLGYHSAWRTGKVSGKSALANTTTKLKRPNKQGVVRSMARLDHWR